MALSTNDQKKVLEIAKLSQEWLQNYKNNGLESDPDMKAAYNTVANAFQAAKTILSKAKTQAPPASAEPQQTSSSNTSLDPIALWAQLQSAWSGFQAIKNGFNNISLDNIGNVVKDVNNFITLCNSFLDVVEKVPFTSSLVKQARQWLTIAQQLLQKAQAGLKLLDLYKTLNGNWKSLKDLLAGGGNTGDISAFINNAKDFITKAKAIPSAADKLAAVQSWLKSAETLAKAGTGLLEWYDKIKAMVAPLLSQTSLIPGTNVDDAILAKANDIIKEIDKWVAAAKGAGASFTDKITELTTLVAKVRSFKAAAEKFVNAIKTGDWQTVYNSIKTAYRDLDKLTGFIPGTNVDDALIAKAQQLKANLEGWLSKFGKAGDLFDKAAELKTMYDKVQGLVNGGKQLADAVKNKDWKAVYEQLATAYRDLDKLTGFVPFTDMDDKLIAKAQDLKKQFEDWLTQTTGMGGDLVDKIAEAKKSVERIKGFVDAGLKLVEAIKNKDWKAVFEQLKAGYNNLDQLTGFVPGTNVDDKIIAQAQKLKASMEAFIKEHLGAEDGNIFNMVEEIQGLYKKVRTFSDSAKKFVENVKNGDWNAVFEQIKAAWSALDGKVDLVKFTNFDDKALAQVQKVKQLIDNFLEKTTGVKGLDAQIEQVKGWIGVVQKAIDFSKGIITDIKNGDYVALFNKIVTAWTDIQKEGDIFKGTTVDDAILAKVQQAQRDIEAFIAKTTGGVLSGDLANMVKQVQDYKQKIEGVISFAKALKGDIENKDFASAATRIIQAWTDLSKQTGGFIPGTNIDDAIVAKAGEFKQTVEAFLNKYSGGALSGDLLNMVEQIKGYYKTITSFITDVKGFIDDIKQGNWSSVYDKIEKTWKEIENRKGDFIPGTTIDEQLYEQAKKLETMATEFLAKMVKGGDADSKRKVVAGWLGSAAEIIKAFTSKKPVLDFAAEFASDKTEIKTPALETLPKAEEDKMLSELTGGMTNETIAVKLRAAINTSLFDITSVGSRIDSAYQQALTRNVATVGVVAKSKAEFDSVIAEQKRIIHLIDTISGLVISVVTSALLSPGAAAVVTAVIKGAKDFSQLADVITGLIPSTGNPMTDMLLQGGIKMLTASLTSNTNTSALNQVGMAEIEVQFRNLVQEKYEVVKSNVTSIQEFLLATLKSLGSLDQTGLDKVKSLLLSRLKQWENVSGQIRDKYLNVTSSRLNEAKAYYQLSRLLYAGWLANNKDISLADAVIDRLTRFDILKDAGVDIGKGFGDKLKRGLGQIFGGWLSFGEDKKLKKLAEFGASEVKTLTQPGTWQNVL